jgi:hypothetical protein
MAPITPSEISALQRNSKNIRNVQWDHCLILNGITNGFNGVDMYISTRRMFSLLYLAQYFTARRINPIFYIGPWENIFE